MPRCIGTRCGSSWCDGYGGGLELGEGGSWSRGELVLNNFSVIVTTSNCTNA